MAIIFVLHLCMDYVVREKRRVPVWLLPIIVVALVSFTVIAIFYLPIRFDGFQFDLRFIPLVFLAIRWGWKYGLSALLNTSLWRLWMGGIGSVPGVIFGMVFPVLLALLFRKIGKHYQLNSFFVFSLITLCWLFCDVPIIFIVPNGWEIFKDIFFIRYGSFILTGYTLSFFIRQSIKENEWREQLQYYAEHDPLTGLYNLRTFMTNVKNHFSPAKQNYIVMADIDHFKHINDTYGHLSGDAILTQLADVFKNVAAQMTGVNILIGRYGGEEFIFFIEMEEDKDIQSVVTAFQDKVRETPFYLEDTNEKIDLTLSFGVCPIENINDLTHSTGKEDKCLYRSKNNGRNQISYA